MGATHGRKKMKILVSACLMGEKCKYNGGDNYSLEVMEFTKGYEVVSVCPEVTGGLPTPRIPCEIVDGVVTNEEGESKDKEFRAGAEKCAALADNPRVDLAILQSRSPSCGLKQVYDGTFSRTLKPGSGVFATLLKSKGIPIVDVEDLRSGKTKPRIVDGETVLIPYYPYEEVTLPWYQNKTLVKQVDNQEELYTLEKLRRMYDYLDANGDLWYIVWRGRIVGDISLRDSGEIAIVIAHDFQNQHIGRRCVAELLQVAREKGLEQVKAEIYDFNAQSRKMFRAAGFVRRGEEGMYIHGIMGDPCISGFDHE